MTLQELINDLQGIIDTEPQKANMPVFAYINEEPEEITGVDPNLTDRIDLMIN